MKTELDPITVDDDIELRSLVLEDVNLLFLLVDKNREHLRKFLVWVDATQSVEAIRIFIEKTIEKRLSKESFAFGIWYSNELVGVVGIVRIDYLHGIAEVGYWLDYDRQGIGIMTRSVQGVINFAFKELGLHRVEIRCAIGNVKSQRIPEKLGFQREGVLKEACWSKGHCCDAILYGVVRTNNQNFAQSC